VLFHQSGSWFAEYFNLIDVLVLSFDTHVDCLMSMIELRLTLIS
jgi:hypothetical protein